MLINKVFKINKSKMPCKSVKFSPKLPLEVKAHPREYIISPQTLRSTLLPFLKHIRLCTLSTDHLVKEVISTKVLTGEECLTICLSMAEEKKCEIFVNVCNEIEKRRSKVCKGRQECSTVKTCKTNGRLSSDDYKDSSFWLTTNQKSVELCDVVCQANGDPDGSTYRCEGTILIYCETETSYTVPVYVSFSQRVESGGEIVIPLTDDGSNVIMKANTRYTVDFSFNEDHKVYRYECPNVQTVSLQVTDGFELLSGTLRSVWNYGNHYKMLHYYNIIT